MRTSRILLVSSAVGVAATLVWAATQTSIQSIAPETHVSDVAAPVVPASRPTKTAAKVATVEVETPPSASPREVAQWLADARSDSQNTRVTAIAALAEAPPATALPVLKDVLEFGVPDPDRQVALQSLYTLAIDNGDRDERIRDTLRYIAYHGDDDAVTESALAYLEDLEIALSGG